uniref:Uncharacterized protein n=1 Tax=Arundo donax TaxID=35708 RepID=A0A0A9BJH0_ARUDO
MTSYIGYTNMSMNSMRCNMRHARHSSFRSWTSLLSEWAILTWTSGRQLLLSLNPKFMGGKRRWIK